MQRTILSIVFIAFGVLTALALWHHGLWGIIEPHFQTFGAGQVFADLVIALCLAMVWMWRDAQKTGRYVWPYLGLTLATGSFGPMLYLLLAPSAKPAATPGFAVQS